MAHFRFGSGMTRLRLCRLRHKPFVICNTARSDFIWFCSAQRLGLTILAGRWEPSKHFRGIHMTVLRKILVGLVISLMPLIAHGSCIDVSGDYLSGIVHPTKGKLVWRFAQTACDSVALGSYYLFGSTVSDLTSPVVNLVHQGQSSLCQMRSCPEFVTSASTLEYAMNGSVKVDGVHRCNSTYIKISLDAEANMIRTFTISDTSASCRNLTTYVMKLQRVQ